MRDYIGKYRVMCEFDWDTLKPIKDDLFIYCSKEGKIWRVNDTTLAYYRPNSSYGYACNLAKKFENNGITVIDNQASDSDILLYFNEADLDEVGKLVGIVTKGCNVPAHSIRNLRKMRWFKDRKEYYISKGLYKENTMKNSELEDL